MWNSKMRQKCPACKEVHVLFWPDESLPPGNMYHYYDCPRGKKVVAILHPETWTGVDKRPKGSVELRSQK
jgi:phage FluMu protein Com